MDATSAGYIDIFSCKYYRLEDTLTFCKDFFEAKDAKYNYLLRIWAEMKKDMEVTLIFYPVNGYMR
uniref:Uncharacterized protein n=2 Tax=Methanosarcinales TaxID=94695 RepID=A0A7G9Y4M5_9EURY|nr:hypothetical protein KEEEGCAB_00007 [Methanosarcinales archaeon ANME-2c ERB4]QNT35667.1 hypothetical protein HAHEADPM_00001 [uncultured Methanosarcinales archaeon]